MINGSFSVATLFGWWEGGWGHVPDASIVIVMCLCISTDITFMVPSFSGRSSLELKKIDKASQDLSIEISFSTLNRNGIILFNAKFKNGSGDFVSLAVKDGFIEFK